MARTLDIPAFVAEHKATDKDVKSGNAKVCTFKDCPCGHVPLALDAFYKDKSMKDGRSAWCKVAERTYNAAYRAGLKGAKAPKKAAIETPKAKKTFESAMTTVRNPRGNGKAPVVRTRNAKKATTRKATAAKK